MIYFMDDIMADYIQHGLSNVSAWVRDPKKIQRAVGFQNLKYNLSCRRKIKNFYHSKNLILWPGQLSNSD